MSNYFNRVPDFEYVSRLPDANISDYIPVKNLIQKRSTQGRHLPRSFCIHKVSDQRR